MQKEKWHILHIVLNNFSIPGRSPTPSDIAFFIPTFPRNNQKILTQSGSTGPNAGFTLSGNRQLGKGI